LFSVGAGVLNIRQERGGRKSTKRRLSGLLRLNSCQANKNDLKKPVSIGSTITIPYLESIRQAFLQKNIQFFEKIPVCV